MLTTVESHVSTDTGPTEADLWLSDLTSELSLLVGLNEVVTQYGLTPELADYTKRCQFLSESSTLALETYGGQSTIATEGLIADLQMKLKSWSGKALASIKATGASVAEKVNAFWTKLSKIFEDILTTTKVAAAATKKMIKAHPYASVAAAIAAALAVGGIVAFVTGALTTASTAAAMASVSGRVVSMMEAIPKNPFGTFAGTVEKTTAQVGVSFTAAPAATLTKGTAESMGWTKSGVQAISSKLTSLRDTVLGMSPKLATGVRKETALLDGVTESAGAARLAKTAGMSKAGIGVKLRWVWSIVTSIYAMIKRIVMPVFNLAMSTMGIVSQVFMVSNIASQAKDAVSSATGNSDEENQPAPATIKGVQT